MRYYSSTAGAMTLTGNVAPGDTTIVVSSTTGLPVSFPYALILDPGHAEEIVDVTAAAGTTLTVTRGVDGTSAQAHSTGDPVRHGFSARDLRESRDHEAASVAVHGLVSGSSVLGTKDVQTVDNKTLQSADGTTTPAKVRAAASQSVAIAQFIDSTGAVRWSIDSSAKVLASDAVALRDSGSATLLGEAAKVSPPANKDGVVVNVPTGSTGYALKVQRNAVNKALVDGDGNVTAVGATLSGALSGTTGAFSGAVSGASGAFSGAVTAATATIAGATGTGDLTATTVTSSGALAATTGTFSGAVTAPNLPASSATKNGKRIHWGSYSVTTSGGAVTFNHLAGFTPTAVLLTSSVPGLFVSVTSISATQITLAARDQAGALYNNTFTVYAFCGE